ncbi:MAG: DUF2225 domain-containing protein [Candidatus Riflebacteria bacterium]|nr:DUF2225 domain-containing protein [Candidatus Riflebacteria bacterium]
MTGLRKTWTEVSCPVCRHVFTYVTVSRPEPEGGQDADFCPKSLEPEILASYIVLCPSCQFAVYQKDFHTTLSDHDRDHLRLALGARVPATGLAPDCGAEKYRQAIRCYRVLNRKTYFLATVHLRGSWWCRACRDYNGERRFQEDAVALLERALREDGQVGSDEIPVITYLIGELNRRLGRQREASEWFEQVPDLVADTNEQKWLIDLTEQQKELNSNTIN